MAGCVALADDKKTKKKNKRNLEVEEKDGKSKIFNYYLIYKKF